MLKLKRKKNEGSNRGGEGTTPVVTAFMSRSWKVEVCPKKKKNSLDEMINQPSAAIGSTSSKKQHKHICQLRTNTTACT